VRTDVQRRRDARGAGADDHDPPPFWFESRAIKAIPHRKFDDHR
jgi:hypothetical protein